MCGIFGYTGHRKAAPLLLDGLRALEYRGYDSAGIYVSGQDVVRAEGEVKKLSDKVSPDMEGKAGIAHTRWATHGKPSEKNAHPHTDTSQQTFIVHNGIIENHVELKKELEGRGALFSSDTDSEVLAHLIEEEIVSNGSFEKAVARALKKVHGSYGIAVMTKREPEKIVIARQGSPIVLGIGTGEYFVASDTSAILKHTKEVIYLEDGECALITPTSYSIFTMDLQTKTRKPQSITWNIEQVQKSGYDHFMLKEIMEGPDVLKNSVLGRLLFETGDARLGGFDSIEKRLSQIERIVIIGCGSAYYAGMVGKLLFEEIGGIPTEVEIASEYRYRAIPPDGTTAVLAISQSGETADTLACLKEAKRRGSVTLGIVNVVGSTVAREVDAGVYNHAGPEISVASTKAFISQLEVLLLFALFLGRRRSLPLTRGKEILDELVRLPEKMQRVLDQAKNIEEIAKHYSTHQNFLYVGRKYNYPMAMEGALKLKEVSYIHAEGYGAGEMKHGPIAMIDETFPTVAVMPKDSVYEKTFSNIEEIRARNGKVLAIVTEGDTNAIRVADHIIEIPQTLEIMTPILSVVPLQLFAYHMSRIRGYNVDRPRNLAKSVTVE